MKHLCESLCEKFGIVYDFDSSIRSHRLLVLAVIASLVVLGISLVVH